MKICVYGAGAIGGTIAARLAMAGRDVTVVARGAHLAAMQSSGLAFHDKTSGERHQIQLRTAANAAEAGQHDLVVCAAKSHSLPAMAAEISAAMKPTAAAVFAVNGVPWWFFHKIGGPHDGAKVISVDPQGLLTQHVRPERAIGCAVYLGAAIDKPGAVTQATRGKLVLGEPDGSTSSRIKQIEAALAVPGYELALTSRIRDDVATKFMGNVATNPLCALLRVPVKRIFNDPILQQFGERVMREAAAIAEAYGVRLTIDVDKRIGQYQSGPVAEFRPSTLQDVEQGRALEIDAIVHAISEIGRRAGMPTENIDMTYAMIRAMADGLGLYPNV